MEYIPAKRILSLQREHRLVRHRLHHEPVPGLLPRLHLRQPQRLLRHRGFRPGAGQGERPGAPAGRGCGGRCAPALWAWAP